MPRVSREQAQNNQLAITDVSARLFREHGFNGVSVSDLMAAAGLTHGGFYGHFASKDVLAAAACRFAFEQSAARWVKRSAAKGGGAAAKAALLETYLSTTARNCPGTSCPTTALVGDVAREPADAPVRAAFQAGVEGLIDILASLENSGDLANDRRQALADFSTMVGALILARATAGQLVSDEFLAAAKARLLPEAVA